MYLANDFASNTLLRNEGQGSLLMSPNKPVRPTWFLAWEPAGVTMTMTDAPTSMCRICMVSGTTDHGCHGCVGPADSQSNVAIHCFGMRRPIHTGVSLTIAVCKWSGLDGRGELVGDVNNDGLEDLYVLNGYSAPRKRHWIGIRDRIFGVRSYGESPSNAEQNADPRSDTRDLVAQVPHSRAMNATICLSELVRSRQFADDSMASGLDSSADGRAFAWIDVDRDGRRDLVVTNAMRRGWNSIKIKLTLIIIG